MKIVRENLQLPRQDRGRRQADGDGDGHRRSGPRGRGRLRMPLCQPGGRGAGRAARSRSPRRRSGSRTPRWSTPESSCAGATRSRRLFKACEGLPPVSCAVVHPCDRDCAARPARGGPARFDRARARRAGGQDPGRRPGGGVDLGSVPDRPGAAQPRGGGAGRGAGPGRRGGSPDEGEPAHRRADGCGRALGDRAADGAAHQPRLRHGRAVLPASAPDHGRRRSTSLPKLEEKVDIVQNAIDLAHVLGSSEPQVAILSAVETVTSKIAVDARGGGAVQDGRPRADHRRRSLTVRWPSTTPSASRPPGPRRSTPRWPGEADILLVPDLEAGNMLAKQLSYLAGAEGPASSWARGCRSC